MSKKRVSLSLALVLALGIFAVPALAAFNASAWAQPELEKAQSYGLTGNKMFSPADSTTREQALGIAVRMLDKLKGKTMNCNGGTTQPPETAQPPSGGGDSAILGNWIEKTSSSATRYYTFNSDGTFKYLEFEGSHASSTEGNYTTSNGKVYFTELISSLGLKYADRVFEYGFGKTSNGESCLLIGTMANNNGERWLYIALDRAVEFTKL